ncbi:ThiF family adenylyltransferase [Phytohabitans rumicis]|uniref:THIF-type NAD/FAD binding fold domain-containing protein n=1 Tax=Phytohabitans rumicis TaxID=1076125 RepID=A0A6V8LMZ4_9ACTN|nr:ThiF family adenylyltransferase [Phytohabitans rumicis]GFJ96248.1 hypothetical protein Prum_098900 [Phytohabitans rumicis]
MDRYARQRGLVAQDLVADAVVEVHGTGPALPYLLQCLALVGAGTRHGGIRLHVPDRVVEEADLAHQFLLDRADAGRPLAEALIDRVELLNPTVDLRTADHGSARTRGRGLGVAVPGAAERPALVAALGADPAIVAWGEVLPTAVYVGPAPLRAGTGGHPTLLTAALAATCGGLLAQVLLGQLGAIIDGPTVLSRWFEERLWIAYPDIGRHAMAAEAEGALAPALRGVLERFDSPRVAERFQILLDGRTADPRVTTVVDHDAVVVTVPAPQASMTGAAVRPGLADPPPVRPLLWSPVDGPTLDGGTVTGMAAAPVPPRTPPRVVLCGAGALGSWAAAVLAASGLPGLDLSIVDMDDTVESHNLNRQVLFDDADVGLPKAAQAMARLGKINPRLALRALPVMVSPETIEDLVGGGTQYELLADDPRWRAYREQVDQLAGALKDATAILSCPDNHQTRWSLNVIAERLGIPLVNGAVDGFVGRVHVCDPGDRGRCLVCWLGESIADEPERRSCTDVVGTAPVPSIVTSAAVIGAAQAATLLAQLGGPASRVRRFHAFDGLAGTLDGYRAADRDPDECPAHLVGAGPDGREAR